MIKRIITLKETEKFKYHTTMNEKDSLIYKLAEAIEKDRI
jgi:hypothetical protein